DTRDQRHLMTEASGHRENCDAPVDLTDRGKNVLGPVWGWIDNVGDMNSVTVRKNVEGFRKSGMEGGDDLFLAINRANYVENSHDPVLHLTISRNPAASGGVGLQP